MERQITEQENLEIIQAVRGVMSAPEDLWELLNMIRAAKEPSALNFGKEDVPLKDLGTSEQITVQAADKAGNYSRTYQVKNPNYKAPVTSQPPQILE